MHSYYRTLGVPRTACQEQIQRAYELLSMAFHPDHHYGLTHRGRAREQFIEIEKAYRVLSNPVRRREYDCQQVWGRQKNSGKGAGRDPEGATRE